MLYDNLFVEFGYICGIDDVKNKYLMLKINVCMNKILYIYLCWNMFVNKKRLYNVF